jgi:hypothetical protein
MFQLKLDTPIKVVTICTLLFENLPFWKKEFSNIQIRMFLLDDDTKQKKNG